MTPDLPGGFYSGLVWPPLEWLQAGTCQPLTLQTDAAKMTLAIAGLGWARRHKREFSGVITIEDPGPGYGLRFHRRPRPDHLILHFADLDQPAPPPYDQRPGLQLASSAQISQAIAFAAAHPTLLVHCHAGVSRSTAVALACLAAKLGPGCEQTALDTVLAIRPVAVPNLHITALADQILARDGALLRVVRAWDATRPDNARRRLLNRRAHFWWAGVPLDIEPALTVLR